ncbi:MAG: Ldh family oxidoreductase [Phycisphaerae bacterium]|nr:Ldh family oxidoreductase [Phycisphaerae bacterium]
MPSNDTKLIPADKLRAFAVGVFEKVGCPKEHAEITADVLIESNLRGVDTHGVFLCDNYCKRLEQGLFTPKPNVTFDKRRAALGTVDGDRGLGQPPTWLAMQKAIEMAKECGLGAVSVRNSNHFGAAAPYAIHAAERGCIGMLWSHGESDVIPFGGRKKFFGTAPICFAAPAGFDTPMYCADMATSQVAFGKIRAAGHAGKEIPPDWAVDADGNVLTKPASDDAIIKDYSAVPMGGAKGYGIAVMIEATCALLTGMPYGPHIIRKFDDWQNVSAMGHYVQAIDVEAFLPLTDFRRRIDEMFKELKAIPPAPGYKEVMIPGEPELRTKAQRLETGCPIAPETSNLLTALGKRMGVPFPS